jgi:succinyl-diaminopimelate desuccinylase
MSNFRTIYLLKKLIRFKTTVDNFDEIYRCQSWLEKTFKSEFPTKVLKSNKIPTLLLGQTDLRKTTVLLLAHLDVVSGKYAQFQPKIKGNKLFGRGATDNKGSAVALLEILSEVYPKNKDVTLALTFDEEVGGKNGTKIISEKVSNKLSCVFVPDAGGNFKICTNSLGVWQFKALLRGVSAHASEPNEGLNAIEKGIKFWNFLRMLFQNNKDVYKLHSLNLGKINGGNAINMIPDSVEMYFDVRYKSQTKLELFQRKIKNYLIAREGVLEDITIIEPFSTDTRNPVFNNFVRFLKSMKIKTKHYTETSSNDARFFVRKGVAVIITKPKGGGAHENDEWVDLTSIQKFKQIVSSFILKQFST